MALKRFIDDLEAVPEELRDQYSPTADGKFALQVEGADPKVKEFRETNISLQKQLAKLEEGMKPFKGIDPTFIQQAQQMQEQLEADEEKKLLKEGKFDEIIQRRLASGRAEMDAQIKAMQDELAKKDSTIGNLTGQLSTLTVDTDVRKAIESEGLKPRSGALDDILTRARQTWKIGEDGAMQPVDEKGDVRFGGDGNPLTMKEYVTKHLVESAAHLFEGASGGGAAGGSGGKPAPFGRTIDGTDPLAMGANLEAVAKGKVKAHLPTADGQ